VGGLAHAVDGDSFPRPNIDHSLLFRAYAVLNNPLDRLRVIGMMEGASFLVLLGIAMPLKYLAGYPQMVSVVGMIHGVLFLLFVAAVLQASVAMRWPPLRMLAALAASVLPFGPFVFDAHLRRVSAAEA
jgi:integral membrane protein